MNFENLKPAYLPGCNAGLVRELFGDHRGNVQGFFLHELRKDWKQGIRDNQINRSLKFLV